MRVQIISEGPTDREILYSIVNIFKCADVELIEESKTQMKRRGKHALLNYEIFSKFLHHGYQNLAEIIIICVDNDDEDLDTFGVGSIKKEIIRGLINEFQKKNSHKYLKISPKYVLAIPVQTIDYWMKCIEEGDLNCIKIRKILNISRSMIKKETYGAANIYLGWVIDPAAISSKIAKIKHDPSVPEKLRCFPSFRDFESQMREAFN
jgi:hypothetical protein